MYTGVCIIMNHLNKSRDSCRNKAIVSDNYYKWLALRQRVYILSRIVEKEIYDRYMININARCNVKLYGYINGNQLSFQTFEMYT